MLMSDISDINHRKLMKRYIEHLENLMDHENFHVEIEKPYNYYGQKGFIDVFYIGPISYNICARAAGVHNKNEVRMFWF